MKVGGLEKVAMAAFAVSSAVALALGARRYLSYKNYVDRILEEVRTSPLDYFTRLLVGLDDGEGISPRMVRRIRKALEDNPEYSAQQKSLYDNILYARTLNLRIYHSP